MNSRPFAEILTDDLLRPLEMHDSCLCEGERPASGEVALPHATIDGQLLTMPESRSGGRAGDSGLYVSGNDVVNWLRFNLEGATPENRPLLDAGVRQLLYTDQVTGPAETTLGQHFLTYCMGWQARDFLGCRLLAHEGGEFGASSFVAMVPERSAAVAVFANETASAAVRSVGYRCLSDMLGAPNRDWTERFLQLETQARDATVAAIRSACPANPDATPVTSYSGRFWHPANGRLTICESERGIEIRFDDAGAFDGTLIPLEHDVYIARCDYPAAEAMLPGEARIRLETDAAGLIEKVYAPTLGATFERTN